MSVRNKPLLIYDGGCNFCRKIVEHWRDETGEFVDYAAYQEVADRFPQIPFERFDISVQLIFPGGEIYEGADAVFRTLALAPGWGWLLWLYRHIPGFAPVSEAVYRWVSEHRNRISVVTRWWGRGRVVPPRYYLTRNLFLIMLAAIYGVAFASMWVQVTGLIGEHGIVPAQGFLQFIEQHLGWERFWVYPTVFWISASDLALKFVCAAGVGLAVLGVLGWAPPLVFFLLWVLYLSLFTVSGEFLHFQWDTMLLEAGFLAIFFAPMRWSLHSPDPPRPSTAILYLYRWLLFRLMFLSGTGKLASGDPTWRSLTALDFHFETQPLPTWLAWYFHQLPGWVHQLAVVAVLFVQIVVPLFIFGPRRYRIGVFWIFFIFQALIILTGNYTYFNLLTITVGLLLIDDSYWGRVLPRRLRELWSPRPVPGWEPVFKHYAVGCVTVLVLFISVFQVVIRAVEPSPLLRPFEKVVEWVDPFRLVNYYGLFTVMTTSRPEIIIEGSRDGKTWEEYDFKWKPGNVSRRPEFVAPHQPRLDWQMWFAALGSYQQNPWLAYFMMRLLQGSPDVERLLEHNPFPDEPPRYIRALMYDYHFSDPSVRDREGHWWTRQYLAPYSPVLQLQEQPSP